VVTIPIDWDIAEKEFQDLAGVDDSPEDMLRHALAVRVVQEAFVLLRGRPKKAGRGKNRIEETRQEKLFEELIPALEGHLVDGTYQAVADRLGMSVGAVRVAAVRLRARFRECLVAVAAKALRMPAGPALDEELRDLFR
jgi:hypothetical protein